MATCQRALVHLLTALLPTLLPAVGMAKGSCPGPLSCTLETSGSAEAAGRWLQQNLAPTAVVMQVVVPMLRYLQGPVQLHILQDNLLDSNFP